MRPMRVFMLVTFALGLLVGAGVVIMWAMLQQAGGLAAGAVETLMHRSPPSTSGRGQRMGRYFRDVTTYRQHVSAQQSDFAVRNVALYFGLTDRWLF